MTFILSVNMLTVTILVSGYVHNQKLSMLLGVCSQHHEQGFDQAPRPSSSVIISFLTSAV